MEIFQQLSNEERFGKHFIKEMVLEEIENNEDILNQGKKVEELIAQWLDTEHWTSKEQRKDVVRGMDIPSLVKNILSFFMYTLPYQASRDTYVSVTSQLAGWLDFEDKLDSIKTSAELIALFGISGAVKFIREFEGGTLYVYSNLEVSNRTREFIEHSTYLPPMVCKPNTLTHNKSSGYITVKNDSLILGKGNHHDEDICLDVLNKMNSVQLQLDTEFLSTVEEEPTFELDTQEKIDSWNKFKKQSYYFYSLITNQNDGKFYLTHKVDKRGRIYSCGYHINTQGPAFKKAMIELANKEIVTGEL